MRSSRGGCRACHWASQTARSSRRPRLPGGLVSIPSRSAAAAAAAASPAGRSRQAARNAVKDGKSVILDGKDYGRWKFGVSRATVQAPVMLKRFSGVVAELALAIHALLAEVRQERRGRRDKREHDSAKMGRSQI